MTDQNHKMWGRRLRKSRLFFSAWAYMNISQKQAYIGMINILEKKGIHKSKRNNWFTKTKRRGHRHTIKKKIIKPQKGKERKKDKHRVNWKTRFKMAINTYLSINYFKYQWTECSNQKTQSGKLDKKLRAYNALPTWASL